MCKSQAEGGQRCAAHTRTRFKAAAETLLAHAAGFNSDDPTQAAQFREAWQAWEKAAIEHASTQEGRRELRAEAAERSAAGDIGSAAHLDNIIKRGSDTAHANAAAARAIREARREANQPGPRAARAVADGRFQFTEDRRAIECSPRFTCETHDQPGSCTPDCTELIGRMSEGLSVDYDPTGTSYPPERPELRYHYDPVKKASLESVIMPLACLDDTSYYIVSAALPTD